MKSSMGIANKTRQRLLHWAIVFSLVAAYASAYYRHWYTSQSEVVNWYLLVIHMNCGIAVFILSIIALIHRFCLPRPADQTTLTQRHVMAKTMHVALYFLLMALPLTAYLGTGFDIPLLGIVNLDGFMRYDFIQTFVQDGLGMLMTTFIEPFGIFHRDTGSDIILPILITGHIGGAIFHKFKTGG